jgi:competence protein ComEA
VLLLLAAIAVAVLLYFGFFWEEGRALSGLADTAADKEDASLAVPTQFDAPEATVEPPPAAAPESVVVYVTGEVAAPGLYSLTAGSRAGDAVAAAGGLTAAAATQSINLAEPLVDGSHIHILNQDDPQAGSLSAPATATATAPATGQAASLGLVNINSADLAQLQTLDGIGPATAQKIIDYRQSNGPFKAKEDLKNVAGIGDKKYAAIALAITV